MSVCTILSPISFWIVPIRPTRCPASVRMCLIRLVMVVFPLVPVTPTKCIFRSGCPNQAAQSCPYSFRVSSVRICRSPSPRSWSASTAAAPLSSAFPAALCPSKCSPRMQANSIPGFTLRESSVRPVISMSGRFVFAYSSNNAYNRIFIPSFHTISV